MNSNKHPIALQLYSLRDLAQQDFVRTLELTAELGYEGVEFAGYGGLSSSEMKDHLDRLNLRAVSTHVSLERLRDHLDEEIAYNRVLGNSTLVCPAPPRGFERTRENWTALGKELTELGKKAADQGFRLGYHNHSFEFEQHEGVYALDLLWEASDPRFLFAQLDLGWVLHGGEDPSGYLRKLAGRTPSFISRILTGTRSRRMWAAASWTWQMCSRLPPRQGGVADPGDRGIQSFPRKVSRQVWRT